MSLQLLAMMACIKRYRSDIVYNCISAKYRSNVLGKFSYYFYELIKRNQEYELMHNVFLNTDLELLSINNHLKTTNVSEIPYL